MTPCGRKCSRCLSQGNEAPGMVELAELCPSCWAYICQSDRDALVKRMGVGASGQPVSHTTINPPLSRWVTVILGFAGGFVFEAALWLIRHYLTR